MFPIGSYEHFKMEIIHCYEHDYGYDDYITFGILIADARQLESRAYILNYLDVFNKKSGRYFDFFVPGFTDCKFIDDIEEINISVNGKKYYFSKMLFDDFCENLKNDFNITYTFNPMLILMSMRLGHIGTAKYILFELDSVDEYGIRRSGKLFENIFEAAQSNFHLDDFKNMFRRTYVKGNLLKSIINSTGKDWLIELRKVHNELGRYKIK